jgi:hypothetical protein
MPMTLKTAFQPDDERYEGVRPVIVFVLRLGYLLVFVTVGNIASKRLANCPGSCDPLQAVALSMWAAHSLLSLIGVFKPLAMLPLVLFEIVYKVIWLVVVALPLWSANRLEGSPAEGLTYSFLPVVVPIVLVPWPFVFRKYFQRRNQPHIHKGETL